MTSNNQYIKQIETLQKMLSLTTDSETVILERNMYKEELDELKTEYGIIAQEKLEMYQAKRKLEEECQKQTRRANMNHDMYMNILKKWKELQLENEKLEAKDTEMLIRYVEKIKANIKTDEKIKKLELEIRDQRRKNEILERRLKEILKFTSWQECNYE